MKNSLVFVYGTLLPGEVNHVLLIGSTFVADGIIQGDLYASSGFPIAAQVHIGTVPHTPAIQGQVYEVSSDTLEKIDLLEGHPNWYKRERTDVMLYPELEKIFAWAYFQDRNQFTNLLLIPSGSWKTHTAKKKLGEECSAS